MRLHRAAMTAFVFCNINFLCESACPSGSGSSTSGGPVNILTRIVARQIGLMSEIQSLQQGQKKYLRAHPQMAATIAPWLDDSWLCCKPEGHGSMLSHPELAHTVKSITLWVDDQILPDSLRMYSSIAELDLREPLGVRNDALSDAYVALWPRLRKLTVHRGFVFPVVLPELLQELVLQDCALLELPAGLFSLKHVTKLVLRLNPGIILPESLPFPDLEILDLAHCGLTVVPPCLAILPNLKKVHLGGNHAIVRQEIRNARGKLVEVLW